MSTGSITILLVILDNPQASRELVDFLAAAGYQVHTETTVEASLERFSASPPDLVLTTLYSPAHSASSLLARFKALNSEVPVIVLAPDQGALEDSVQALREGASDYLVAPMHDTSLLLQTIDNALATLAGRRLMDDQHDSLVQSNRELREYVDLLERDHRAARRVQEKLLPNSPAQFDGVTLAHRILPSLIISGDFVDYGLFEQRWLCFYLTDVSGHGASSAFVTMWLKQLVRRLFRERRLSEGETSSEIDVEHFMETINRELVSSQFGCHLTCFVGIIDLESRKMRYVLGGHLPLPIIVVNGEARYLQGKGKPLGLFKDARWEVYQTQLQEPFSLIVFSDGVLEILASEDLIDKEAELLTRVSETGGEMARIISAFELDSRVEAPDDIAVLTVNAGEVS